MIQELLDEIGWTQPELARRVGCSRTVANDWCTGKTRPPPAVVAWLKKLAKVIRENTAPEWRVRAVPGEMSCP